ncbi:hypothetical protein [Gelidibacter sediminis]|uniref:hypothetical protein n=1 Tax=Gelidibacter sediminis TaxID=1608710 RepID=UPI001061CD52|nr:hypothetical protein [Gelidibacter sediminis]
MIIGLSYLGYKGYRNYQRNEIIKKSNTNLIFSDSNSKFKKPTYSDSEFEFNNSLLKSISKLKDSVITEFLNRTTERIVFIGPEIDTLTVKVDNRLEYDYSSSLDKGNYDKDFNEYLVNSLKPFLLKNNIGQIEIYTLVPTEYSNIPLPIGTLTNFDIEKEYDK